jgi:hypothetical protein
MRTRASPVLCWATASPSRACGPPSPQTRPSTGSSWPAGAGRLTRPLGETLLYRKLFNCCVGGLDCTRFKLLYASRCVWSRANPHDSFLVQSRVHYIFVCLLQPWFQAFMLKLRRISLHSPSLNAVHLLGCCRPSFKRILQQFKCIQLQSPLLSAMYYLLCPLQAVV